MTQYVIVRAFRRLVGLVVALALVSAVTAHAGPQLAARSMSGYVAQLDAAQAGDYSTADSIGSSLRSDWLSFEASASRLWTTVESELSKLAPGR